MPEIIVVEEKLDLLPFHDLLTWERFQLFCTDLLYQQWNSVDSREYLNQGNGQHGIDVYAVPRGEEKLQVAQCKLKEYMGPAGVRDIIDDFLKGGFVEKTKEFILCTSANLSRQRDEEETITEARRRLGEKDIALVVWDQRGLSTVLRNNPSPAMINIVYRYFNEDICLLFYGDLWLEHIRVMRLVPKKIYPMPADYMERTINPVGGTFVQTDEEPAGLSWANPKTLPTLSGLFRQTHPENGSRIMLLSIAGFGKSIELNQVAAHYSAENRQFYPVKFSLKNYEGQALEEILAAYHVDWKNIPDEQLLLIFDGLDEINAAFMQSFFRKVNAFTEQHPMVSLLVSSRYNFYNIDQPPLNNFESYRLDPLTWWDIDRYKERHLGVNKEDFQRLIDERRFAEYHANPYYLTRLVRFYKEQRSSFPQNKAELFEQILFEKVKLDTARYLYPELKKELYPVAQQIAFCMTVSGKNAIGEEGLRAIGIGQEQQAKLVNFSILNKNTDLTGSWSFEHKNLQEYLCATVFAGFSFEALHSVISFQFDRNRLLPRFLNTVSFLFELIGRDTALFQALFDWLHTQEPELLIRFEKEQLAKQTRHAIFKQIFLTYKQEDQPLYASSNFSIKELAQFTGIDHSILAFLEFHLTPFTSLRQQYDILDLLTFYEEPYTAEEKLSSILYGVLANPDYSSPIKADAIWCFTPLQFRQQQVFDRILASPIDLQDFPIRRACIAFLDGTDYAEDYLDLIFDSVPLFDREDTRRNDSGASEMLKRMISGFRSGEAIRRLLQTCIRYKDIVSVHDRFQGVNLGPRLFKQILENATLVYRTDPSILKLVYRIYCSVTYIYMYKEWHEPFIQFFRDTCGLQVLFHKCYQYDKRDRELLVFADEASCGFLIEEFKAGCLTVPEMIVYRNVLSHLNKDLFSYFYQQLLLLPCDEFVIADIDVDYGLLRTLQKEKNQEMLLDRELFLDEADSIFFLLQKEQIRADDLWHADNAGLRKYETSLAMEAIRDMCIHGDDKVTTREEFHAKYEDREEWTVFVTECIRDLLEGKNEQVVLRTELRQFAEAWCTGEIDRIDFEKLTIIDHPDRTYNYYPHTEFVKQFLLLLQLQLSDQQLLKLLVSDYHYFYNGGSEKEFVAAYVIKEVKDRVALREAVLKGIRNPKLSFRVHMSLFRICRDLSITDCLPDLYRIITGHPLVSDFERRTLAVFYKELGGNLKVFLPLLQLPAIPLQDHSELSWQWFLVEELLYTERERVTEVLLDGLAQDDFGHRNHVLAAEYLIKLSRIEGLRFWHRQCQQTGTNVFEDSWESLLTFLASMDAEETTFLLFDALSIYFATGVASKNAHRPYRSFDWVVYNGLIVIALKNWEQYNAIKMKAMELQGAQSSTECIESLKAFRKRLTQRFLESADLEIGWQEANTFYQDIANK